MAPWQPHNPNIDEPTDDDGKIDDTVIKRKAPEEEDSYPGPYNPSGGRQIPWNRRRPERSRPPMQMDQTLYLPLPTLEEEESEDLPIGDPSQGRGRRRRVPPIHRPEIDREDRKTPFLPVIRDRSIRVNSGWHMDLPN